MPYVQSRFAQGAEGANWWGRVGDGDCVVLTAVHLLLVEPRAPRDTLLTLFRVWALSRWWLSQSHCIEVARSGLGRVRPAICSLHPLLLS